MNKYEISEIMDIACRAGKIILENGGEIYRVEETMLYICRAFGIMDCECYATPTTIIISIIDTKGEVFSRMIRISVRGVNLAKIEAVNDFSRELVKNPMTVESAKQELMQIATTPAYSLFVTLLASALGTGAFTIIFSGGFDYLLYGIFMGAILRIVVMTLNRVHLGHFTINLIGGSVAALGGWFFNSIGLISDWWIVTLATLMLLVPGLLFTNALRDSAAGDLVSGLSRGTEALSIVTALAFGAGGTLLLLTRLGGG